MTEPSRFALCVLLMSCCAQLGHSQDPMAYVHALGRAAGVGFTRGGYHAAGGQIPMVKRHHPPASYRSRHLMYAYAPGYQPMRVTYPQQGLPRPNGYSSHVNQFGQPTPAANQAETITPLEEVPRELPPEKEWLKKYLDQKESTPQIDPDPRPFQSESTESLPSASDRDELPPPPTESSARPSPFRFDDDAEVSPSDRPLNDDLLGDPLNDDLLGPPPSNPPGSGARDSLNQDDDLLDGGLLDDDDNLLDEGDDDLLLLDSDDFSAQAQPRFPRSVPVLQVTRRASPKQKTVVNRYLQQSQQRRIGGERR